METHSFQLYSIMEPMKFERFEEVINEFDLACQFQENLKIPMWYAQSGEKQRKASYECKNGYYGRSLFGEENGVPIFYIVPYYPYTYRIGHANERVYAISLLTGKPLANSPSQIVLDEKLMNVLRDLWNTRLQSES